MTTDRLPTIELASTPIEAVTTIEDTLSAGLDPERVPARSSIAVPAGELLLMPAALSTHVGVKIAGVAAGNPARGLPRITGSYLLLDGPTLQPLALFDGAALTAIRTPAVTAVALRRLAVPDASHLVLFGTGPQAYAHLRAMLAIRPLTRLTVVARRVASARALAEYARSLGVAAAVGGPEAVAGADIVVCATTARTPLFDGDLVPAHAAVAAVGSHEPTAREVDTALVRRSAVYVEARAAALEEAGDLIIPTGEQAFDRALAPVNLAELVRGRAAVPDDRPRLFKSVGMAWEDLAVAVHAYRRYAAEPVSTSFA
ncbi:ornithine cyclodeaminase family protein (plasmid) [Embleya sp. NBC_00888]|uniref:ornithine cyclodeaminase family protein n=1 Tax=Embleya sp. NBC_00888 TaxID=2975960 RepID=UPI002F90EC4A|nr:ornithine cyclodeaminase family protein [Embleya sp. NBC_00888]